MQHDRVDRDSSSEREKIARFRFPREIHNRYEKESEHV